MDRRVRRAVLQRLAAVEEMAARAGAALSGPVARKHFRTITGGWRELLVQHQPDTTGRCPVCSGWLRRRRWPCEVWVTAHRHLIGDGTEPVERPARKSHPFRRPRQVLVVPRQLDAPHADKAAVWNLSQRSETDGAPVHRTEVTEHATALSRLRRGGHPRA
ncbi:MAG: hypothetical protein ACRDTD_02565 [Pseudonocardiaceae bacterium]